MKLILRFSQLVVLAGLSLASTARADTLTVNWNNDSNTKITDSDGTTPLSQGAAGTNSDGDLIQLGFYDAGTSADPFLGNWVPLTGAGPSLTTIGDSADLSGAGAGIFQFNTFFATGTNSVDVYVNGFDNGFYTTLAGITVTSSAPPAGVFLAIRFYNTHDGTSGLFNAVADPTDTDWAWKTPDNVSVLNLALTDSGLVWQNAATPFSTTLPVAAIPEPSSLALIGCGVALLPLLRRRKA